MKLEKETYTKSEVRELLEPLMKQIEFYNGQNIQLKSYIRNNWIPFGRKVQFLKEIRDQEDNSNTLIFNIVKQLENERRVATKEDGRILFQDNSSTSCSRIGRNRR